MFKNKNFDMLKSLYMSVHTQFLKMEKHMRKLTSRYTEGRNELYTLLLQILKDIYRYSPYCILDCRVPG